MCAKLLSCYSAAPYRVSLDSAFLYVLEAFNLALQDRHGFSKKLVFVHLTGHDLLFTHDLSAILFNGWENSVSDPELERLGFWLAA